MGQVIKQMVEFGMNITKDDLIQAKLEIKKPEEKKPEEKKPADKKPEDKKPEEKKPAEKKPEEKKPAEKKPDEKKPADKKKPEEKKPADKKPEEKKPAEKKPEEKKPKEAKPEEVTVTLTMVQMHDQIVELVRANVPPTGFSKFNVQYIKPDDKKVLEFVISPRNFKRKSPEELTVLISEQVIKQMVEFGFNITKDDLTANLTITKPEEKKPEEKKPEEKKPEDKKPE